MIQCGNVLYTYTKRFACFCRVSVFDDEARFCRVSLFFSESVFAESSAFAESGAFLLSQLLLSQLFADEARYC